MPRLPAVLKHVMHEGCGTKVFTENDEDTEFEIFPDRISNNQSFLLAQNTSQLDRLQIRVGRLD